MSSITISLSPNTEQDDTRLTLSTLLQPWRWYRASDLNDAASQLTQHFPGHHIAFTSSGRAATAALLDALHIGVGDEVIIQAFTCLAVPEMIKASGATPVYADIEADTFNLDPASVRARLTPQTRAIIVQHTFGIPGPLAELQAIAREHHLTLVEDCAHALGGALNGQPLGTLGDAAILSFGRDKCLSSVFGGAVISRNEQLITAIRAAETSKPRAPRWWIAQQLLHPLALSLIIPLYFRLSLGKVLLVALQRLRLLSKAVTRGERQGHVPPFVQWQYPAALARLAARQLTKLDRFTVRRRAIAARYHEHIPLSPPAAQHLKHGAWLRFPLRVTNPTTFLRAARRQHMLLGDWYNSPVAPCACTANTQPITGYTPGSCPVAEDMSQHIVNLPTYPKLTDTQVARVIAFVKKYDDTARR